VTKVGISGIRSDGVCTHNICAGDEVVEVVKKAMTVVVRWHLPYFGENEWKKNAK
jgi:hypothetical protein